MNVDWGDPATAVLTLLLCGHVFADFLFQTARRAEAKRRSIAAVFDHALRVGLVQGIVVLPFAWSPRRLVLLIALTLGHLVVDLLKIVFERRHPARALTWFLLDQGGHVALLLGAWMLWGTGRVRVPPPEVLQAAVAIAIFVFNWSGGSAIVTAALAGMAGPTSEAWGPPDRTPIGAGKRIGILERWIVLTMVWLGQWGAVGLVLTAKSVARFKRLDDRRFAEVYLVGTMTSVLVAIASGLALGTLIP